MLLLIAFLVSLFLYAPSLEYYFFQDDFFEINISQAKNLWEYLSFFKFRDDIIAYRPISLQNYFFIASNLFGLNPVGFRLITLLLFFLSGFFIYKVITKIFRSALTGTLAAFFWLTSSIHFMAITWIAAAYNIIGTFFWLLTSFILLKYLDTRKTLYFASTFFIFLVTVGSFEFSVTWPVIWGAYYFFVLKNSIFKSLKLFSPFIITSIVYILARLIFIKVPQIPEYDIAVNVESAKSFFWYVLWTFNIPEEFKKQVVSTVVGFNPIFLAEFWKITTLQFTSFLWIITLSTAASIRVKHILNFKMLYFSMAFFALGISPVLILPNHTFAMYLTLASIGLYALIVHPITLLNNRVLILAIVLIWIFSSYTTISFYKINSWMIEAQKVADVSLNQIKEQYPILPTNSTVLYYLPFSWQRQALSDQESIKTIFDDPTLAIYYNEKELRDDAKLGKIRGPIYLYDNEK